MRAQSGWSMVVSPFCIISIMQWLFHESEVGTVASSEFEIKPFLDLISGHRSFTQYGLGVCACDFSKGAHRLYRVCKTFALVVLRCGDDKN